MTYHGLLCCATRWKKISFYRFHLLWKYHRWRPKQSPLRRTVANEPKKKQSLKSEFKNSTKQKESDIFCSRRINTFKVFTGERTKWGKKIKKKIKNLIKLFSRLLCNYFETFEIHIHHFCRTAYCMLVSDQSKISYHSRNTIFFETKIKRFLRNWYSATRVSQQETLFFSI